MLRHSKTSLFSVDASTTLPRQKARRGQGSRSPCPVAAADAVRGTRGRPPKIQGTGPPGEIYLVCRLEFFASCQQRTTHGKRLPACYLGVNLNTSHHAGRTATADLPRRRMECPIRRCVRGTVPPSGRQVVCPANQARNFHYTTIPFATGRTLW
jgi:hypothetical protein